MKLKWLVIISALALHHLITNSYAQQTNSNLAPFGEIKAKAETDDSEAQTRLGRLYCDGRGVEKDFVEAYAWLNLAARFDEKSTTLRDSLELRMTPQQIADGQKRSKELRVAIETKKQRSSTNTNATAVALMENETNKLVAQIKVVQPNGTIRETYVGGSIFKEEHKRPMRTGIWTRDIFGRKENAGYTELRFQGITSDGLIVLQFTEVETDPSVEARTSLVHIGNARGTIIQPVKELPPNTTQFSFDPAKETELAIAGFRVRFLEFSQQKLKFSYAK